MTQVLQLVKRDDFSADISALDLLGAGYILAEEGFSQAVANFRDADMLQALSLHVVGSDDDNLATRVQAIDAKILETLFSGDQVERYLVWLRAKQSAETQARQTLVLEAKRPDRVATSNIFAWTESTLPEYTLGLRCVPWWEATAHVGYTATVGMTGGKAAVAGGPITGDLPARIARTTMAGNTMVGGQLGEVWMGFRGSRFGTPADFVPVWETEAMFDFAADTSVINDAGASGGQFVRISFATQPGMALRRVGTIELATGGASSLYESQRGEFMVLARLRVNASTTKVGVRIGNGFSPAGPYAKRDRILISGMTDWGLFPLGRVRLPPAWRTTESAGMMRSSAVSIEAERISAAGTLDIDCLILIPLLEGFMHVGSAFISTFGFSSYLRCKADGQLYGTSVDPNAANQATRNMDTSGVSLQTYHLPIGSPYVVAAAQYHDPMFGSGQPVHSLGCILDVTFDSYRRYAVLRGNA